MANGLAFENITLSLIGGPPPDPVVPPEPGWWEEGVLEGLTPKFIYSPIDADDQASSYLDVSSAGNDATLGVAPTWANGTGWTFNGTNQYLRAGSTMTSGNTIMILLSNVAASGTFKYVFAALETPRFTLSPRFSSTQKNYGWGDDGTNQVSGTMTAGSMGLAGNAAYHDGIFRRSCSGTFVGTSLIPFIGAAHNSGAASNFTSCTVKAVACYEETLTSGQMSALHAAMSGLS